MTRTGDWILVAAGVMACIGFLVCIVAALKAGAVSDEKRVAHLDEEMRERDNGNRAA